MMLRQAARGAEAQEIDRIVNASGKMVLLNKLLPKLRSEGHKVRAVFFLVPSSAMHPHACMCCIHDWLMLLERHVEVLWRKQTATDTWHWLSTSCTARLTF